MGGEGGLGGYRTPATALSSTCLYSSPSSDLPAQSSALHRSPITYIHVHVQRCVCSDGLLVSRSNLDLFETAIG